MGKEILLIRHAKAKDARRKQADSDRKLAPKGRQQALDMGQFLLDKSWQPDLILSSFAKRSLETTKGIQKAFDTPSEEAEWPEIYNSTSSNEILDLIHGLSERWQRVAIVGHNPLLKALFAQMTDLPYWGPLHKAGIIHLRFRRRRWFHISKAELLQYWTPQADISQEWAFHAYYNLAQQCKSLGLSPEQLEAYQWDLSAATQLSIGYFNEHILEDKSRP